jgi:hypothetical protein
MKPIFAKLSAMMVTICAITFLTLSIAQAAPDFRWCDGMSDMLHSFQTSYPSSNFEPYFLKEASLREATARGDKKTLRAEIKDTLKMVRTSHVEVDAAIELVNYLYTWHATLTAPVKYARSQ